ncbi:MAG: hypothetical protein NC038_03730 [Paludibacter sp.]|nr:hypothetical protein [Bacteroidales bacterium]MCM1069190.1 hypothetical protein [Prevotella sp.]MCM1354095.1 hypothetical protein [Bacteroides sp.]MCM1442932.1 hypothetical protein [Muribaculum sp.]MCM1481745.1 hypothetical protein [Paludibacter sp.]
MKTKYLIIAVLFGCMPSVYAVQYACRPLVEISNSAYSIGWAEMGITGTAGTASGNSTASSVRVAGIYVSTIYAPFAAELPSTYAAQEAFGEGMVKRKAFGGMGMGSSDDDDPNRSKESPIGDAWALVVLALGYMVVCFIRRNKLQN